MGDRFRITRNQRPNLFKLGLLCTDKGDQSAGKSVLGTAGHRGIHEINPYLFQPYGNRNSCLGPRCRAVDPECVFLQVRFGFGYDIFNLIGSADTGNHRFGSGQKIIIVPCFGCPLPDEFFYVIAFAVGNHPQQMS